MPKPDHPDQLYLFAPVSMTRLGDGRYAVSVGEPQQWLTTAEAAQMLRIDQTTIARWAADGRVIARRVGLRKYQIDAQSLYAFAGEPMNHLK